MIAENPYCILEENPQKGHWADIFGNDNPIHIEVGMGKGRFLMTLARQNPHINYIGIEKYSSVLIRALEKMEEDPLPNIRFSAWMQRNSRICLTNGKLPGSI